MLEARVRSRASRPSSGPCPLAKRGLSNCMCHVGRAKGATSSQAMAVAKRAEYASPPTCPQGPGELRVLLTCIQSELTNQATAACQAHKACHPCSPAHRGLDNRVYYVLAPGGEYYNYSGCGNTLNCNHPSVRQFILDCLKFWVQGAWRSGHGGRWVCLWCRELAGHSGCKRRPAW